ncbi:hypothetical protein DFH07DRAFT_710126, partial [Mycena maculata]
MTAHASQGKSRDRNVCHLNNCNDHRAYYVALSRGHKAESTVIVQGFDAKKITCGLNGYLRQEFRELEILDEITRLRYEGVLPRSVTGIYRGQLITSYRKWKGKSYVEPSHFHEKLKWESSADDKCEYVYGEWSSTLKKGGKRRAEEEVSEGQRLSKKKKMNDQDSNSTSRVVPQDLSALPPPVGLIWDSSNWSCGYDSLLTPLSSLVKDDPVRWT